MKPRNKEPESDEGLLRDLVTNPNDSHHAAPTEPSRIIAHIDGASRGNPGPAACAVVIESADGTALHSFSRRLGKATNNFAEYQALLAALEYALQHRHLRLRVLSDSELLVRQVEGRYKVKHAGLKPLHQQATELIAQFESFQLRHVPREQNREADRLANQALDTAAKSTLHQRAVEAAQRPAPPPELPTPADRLRASAVYRKGILEVRKELPLAEGEEVQLEIRRKKPHAD